MYETSHSSPELYLDVLEKHQQDTELQQLTLKLLVSISQLAKVGSYQQS
jgi:hypothetical protein